MDQEARLRRREEARARIRRRRITAVATLAALVAAVAAVVVLAGSGSDTSDPGTDPEDREAEALPEEPVKLTIAASGDLLIHSPVFFQALANGGGERYDFRPMLRQVRRIVRGADLGICHLEEPLTNDAPSGEPTFRAPASLANTIRWVGWDACSTASNHSYDGSEEGISFTIRRLNRAGIGHSGTNLRPRAPRAAMMEARGVKVALLAYSTQIIGMAERPARLAAQYGGAPPHAGRRPRRPRGGGGGGHRLPALGRGVRACARAHCNAGWPAPLRGPPT